MQISAGKELDVLVAEKFMGLSLIPHPDYAKAKVVWKHVSVTGRVFELYFGGAHGGSRPAGRGTDAGGGQQLL